MFYHPKMISGINDGTSVLKDQVRKPHLPQQAEKSHRSEVHRTLIPVDGSENANRALGHIIRSARHGLTSEIHLINVQPAIVPCDFAWDDVVEGKRQARLTAGETTLEHARKLLNDNKVACKVAVRFGATAKTIVQYAREHDIDAIVMGMRSRSWISRLFGRSVSARVARMADIPVVVLNPGRVSSRISAPEKPYDFFTPILAP